MAQSFFITATGTDVGKTYVTGLLLKAMRQKGIHAGYYKAALSGAEYVDGKRIPGDAYAVKETAQLEEPLEEMVSYVYDTAVSPHLATKLEGNPPELAKIQADFQLVQSHYDSVLVEGSGGLVCPLRWDDTAHILLEDVITMLKLPVLLVADAGLGTLNTVTLTAHYAREKGIDVKGILLNRFHPGNLLEEDNRRMVEELTGLPVLAVIGEQSRELTLSEESWQLLKGVCYMTEQERLQAKDLQYIWHPCSQMKDYEILPPIVIDHGKGAWLYDVEGKAYLDVVSSWWCNLLGHCNEEISRAMQKQLDTLEHVIFANFTHRPAIQLCEELLEVLPKGLCKFNFSDNGSAAVECALKMAFQYQYQTGHREKQRFMALSDGYHGETIGALSVGGLDLYAEIYKPMLLDIVRVEAPDCYRCPYGQTRENCTCPCIAKAEQAFAEHGQEIAGFILEPLLQGSAGMRMYPPLYLQKIRQLCDQYGVLLIADEIATGFGRTGKFFACDHAGITPDLLCLSKGLTGGYLPMSLTVTTQKVYDAFYDDYCKGKAFMHSHTYSGNPLGCSAALAVLHQFKTKPILAQATQRAEFLTQKLTEALGNHPNVGEIRHIGLIHAVELVANKETKAPFPSCDRVGYQIYKKALQKGLLLRPLGDVLYLNPPLTINEEELTFAVETMTSCMTEFLAEYVG